MDAADYVFVSHVEEDADAAIGIAVHLEEAGYATWVYEVDSLPGGAGYLLQTGEAIEHCRAFLLVISPAALTRHRQMRIEIVRAHECGKDFIPVLRGVTDAEYKQRQPEWRQAIGAANSVYLDRGREADVAAKIVAGLARSGFARGEASSAKRLQDLRHERELAARRQPGATESPATDSRPRGAVFVSYAAEDLKAARRLSAALSNEGVEVWLRSPTGPAGDEWRERVRQSLHACTLFLPLISQRTQPRSKAAVFAEWDAALKHTRRATHPVIQPIVIDGTTAETADVPSRFREHDWIHLPDGKATADFLARLAVLLSESAVTPDDGTRKEIA